MKSTNIYKRYRFPSEIIQYTVWLYYRFNLSHRDIEDLFAERGINVTYESIRFWCNGFGPKFGARLKRKHRGYGVAHRELIPDTIHDTSQYANNRTELSHQPTRVRERGMRRFKSVAHAQRVLGIHSVVYNLFNLSRHLISASHYRLFRMPAFASWKRAVV
jgi:transposase-like protein